MHFDPEHRHIRSHFLWIAEGGEWDDRDLMEDLHADVSDMTADDQAKALRIARQGVAEAKRLWAEGHRARAREHATATAAEVADVIKLVPEGKRAHDRSEDRLGPRELAAKIRRQ
jgi:hypothetical protein